MFFRSDVLRRLGGFDERFFMYFEDFDLSIRAKDLARNVYYPSAYVVHERQSAHKKSWRLKFVFAKSACLYFSKWGWISREHLVIRYAKLRRLMRRIWRRVLLCHQMNTTNQSNLRTVLVTGLQDLWARTYAGV